MIIYVFFYSLLNAYKLFIFSALWNKASVDGLSVGTTQEQLQCCVHLSAVTDGKWNKLYINKL